MSVEVVFETHSLTEDNERGIATGWLPGRLSERGRALAAELGERRRDGGFAAFLVSDLARAAETAAIACAGWDIPVLHDWRLRETNFGTLNGRPIDEVRAVTSPHERFPGGESRAEAISRVDRAIDEATVLWDGERVLVIAHMSTYWALERRAHGIPLPSPSTPFTWQEGWTYRIEPLDAQQVRARLLDAITPGLWAEARAGFGDPDLADQ